MVTTAALTNPFLHLQRNADENPHGVFMRSPADQLTNAEAVVEVKKLAYELRRLGVRAGDIVALDMPDRLGILFTEAVYHEAAISTILPQGSLPSDGVPVRWLFTSRTPRDLEGATVVSVDSAFLQEVNQNPYGISSSEEPIEVLRIVFSSGTTGTPKAIALGREMEQLMDLALPSWFRAGPNLSMMDTGTPTGIGEFFLSVKGGQPYLCVGGDSQEGIVRVILDNTVRTLKGSPAQVAALVRELEAQGRTVPSVDIVSFAGTVMPPGVAERMRRVSEGCQIFSSYGSTEAGAATRRLYESDDPFDLGQISPGSVVEIVDEDDRPLPQGETGRIRHRSPGMTRGYLGDPDATAKNFKDGWFYPGDLGFIRDDGGLSLAGRETEILNAGGVKIDPNRIDHAALQHPRVIDACSFNYAGEAGLEQIGLALVTEDDVDVSALVADLKAEFGHGAPTLVARVDEVPRNAMGKPMRRTLAERFSET